MRTEGILNFYRSVVDGTLRLDCAQVSGEISLRGARVADSAGEAIAASGLTVDGDMECNAGFTARGQVNPAPRTDHWTAELPGRGHGIHLSIPAFPNAQSAVFGRESEAAERPTVGRLSPNFTSLICVLAG
jgi:hypothetical protein